MIFLYDNVIDDVAVVARTCASGYPVANVQDGQLAKVYRSTSDSTQWFYFNLGDTDTPVNYFAIAEHNLTTSAKIKFQVSTSSGFGSGLSTQFTATAGMIIKAVTATTKKYVRFYFEDATNPDGYIEIGRVFAGTKFDVTTGSKPEFVYKTEDTSVTKWSLTGQGYGDDGVTYRVIEEVDSPIVDTSQKTQFLSMYETVKRTKPVFLLMYPTATTIMEPLYCNFVDPPVFTHLEGNDWEMQPLTFREAK